MALPSTMFPVSDPRTQQHRSCVEGRTPSCFKWDMQFTAFFEGYHRNVPFTQIRFHLSHTFITLKASCVFAIGMRKSRMAVPISLSDYKGERLIFTFEVSSCREGLSSTFCLKILGTCTVDSKRRRVACRTWSHLWLWTPPNRDGTLKKIPNWCLMTCL